MTASPEAAAENEQVMLGVFGRTTPARERHVPTPARAPKQQVQVTGVEDLVLSPHDKAILDHESGRRPANRDGYVGDVYVPSIDRGDRHGLRYQQHLFRIVDHPAAVAYDPVTVHRIQAARDKRRADRAARRDGSYWERP